MTHLAAWLALAIAPQDQPAAVVVEPVWQARRAVERSLPFIEKGGVQWMRERKCSSCHHVTFLVWSHREARERGFDVDAKKLDEWTKWAVDFSLTSKGNDGKRNGGGLDTLGQVILARRPYGKEAPAEAADREIADLILGMQKPEGFWEAGGQLPSQRRPKPETDEATTRWALLSLEAQGPGDDARKAALEKARKWLADRKPGKSNEVLVTALLTTKSEALLKELLARQNEDGGWGWLQGEPSDALATGQTLYALGSMGAAPDPKAVRRAWEFLGRTQREDGSWKVPSTKAKAKDDAISTYWGTAWAAIGLLRTLPD